MKRTIAFLLVLAMCLPLCACGSSEKVDFSTFRQKGNVVTFGQYEQDDDTTNGNEPIEWVVLKYDEKNNKALLISKDVLECVQYYPKEKNVTWEASSVRKWLNGEFIDEAFSKKEKDRIIDTEIITCDNSVYGTAGGNDTIDKVFLLAEDELHWLVNSSAKTVLFTKHARKQTMVNDARWWLRTPGKNGGRALLADSNSQRMIAEGFDVTFGIFGVRPVMWVNVE